MLSFPFQISSDPQDRDKDTDGDKTREREKHGPYAHSTVMERENKLTLSHNKTLFSDSI